MSIFAARIAKRREEDEEKELRIKNGFVKTNVGDDSFAVVPVGEETERMHCIITLNETANRIYDGIEAGLEADAIARKLASEYAVPLEKALRDVKATFEKLVTAGVAEWAL